MEVFALQEVWNGLKFEDQFTLGVIWASCMDFPSEPPCEAGAGESKNQSAVSARWLHLLQPAFNVSDVMWV